MDFASFIGIIAGLTLITSAIFLGGEAQNFINVPGAMIVIGGTVAATLLTFPITDVWAAFKSAFRVFSKEKQQPQELIYTMMELSKLARRNGLLALSDIETNSHFLKRAANLLVDAADEAVFEHTLRTEINALKIRHFAVQEVFKRMAIYAPAFGMLGTLIGLIQMLAKIEDPSTVGPAMAVALLRNSPSSAYATKGLIRIRRRCPAPGAGVHLRHAGEVYLATRPQGFEGPTERRYPSKDHLDLARWLSQGKFENFY